MTALNKVQMKQVFSLGEKIGNQLNQYEYLEQAAQKFIDIFYEEFSESITLARMFITLSYKNLPGSDQAFVSKLAALKNVSHLLNDNSSVLSLLGTRGVDPAWNDRKNSQGHLGIPLVSSSFVDSIPMISRLLTELGVGIDWIDKEDTAIVQDVVGSGLGSVFYVEDASTALDKQGRKIISSTNFVDSQNVRTTFGVGGSYTGRNIIVLIVFTHEVIRKSAVLNFTLLGRQIVSGTKELFLQDRIFVPG
jgi:hypothetical protein